MKQNRKLTIAFQGEPGAFSEAAAFKLLGPQIKPIPCKDFEDLFRLVTQRKVDRAIIPIENSLVGSIHRNYDLLLQHDLPIVGECYLRIVHNLIGLPGAKVGKIKRVLSHQVALGQCLHFFKENSQLEAIPAFDTAGSVKMIMNSGDPTQAAIASAGAAKTYGGKILAPGIEDNKTNTTRFLLISHPRSIVALKKKTSFKTSLVFRLKNHPGSLFRALAVFALRDIDLKKIESRPIPGTPWEYLFYVDIGGQIGEPSIDRSIHKAIEHLSEFAESIRVLGSYPVGKL